MEAPKEYEVKMENLSDFINNSYIIKNRNIAEIIVDFYNQDINKPIRLIGFQTNANKSDFEIFEEGFYYLQELKNIFNII